jgi:phenylacetate-CoA ligase
MVLLNYRLDDWGVMAQEPCACGRALPVLERLEGRSSEFLRLADGRVLSSLTLDALCDEELQLTLQIQIAQPAPGQIQWRIVPWPTADPDTLRRNLLKRCGVVLGEDTQVDVEFVEHIPVTAAGKFPRVVSHTRQSDEPNVIAPGNG